MHNDIPQKNYDNLTKQHKVDADAPHVSSHWQSYLKHFEIKTDRNGKVVSVDGFGFGACQWDSRLHKTIDLACVFSYLAKLSNRRDLLRTYRQAKFICKRIDLDPTLDIFRQACTLAFLEPHFKDLQRQHRVLIIGDGYGVLAALFKTFWPKIAVALIDLDQTLLVQAINCGKVFPDCHHQFAEEFVEGSDYDFMYCPAGSQELLLGHEFDLVVNVASMQEMTNDTIANYFHLIRTTLRSDGLFYCCNRAKKILPDGEITEIMRYPWEKGDIALVDEFCPWYQYFFAFYRAAKGPSFFGLRLPIINYYDGPIIHRLVKINTLQSISA